MDRSTIVYTAGASSSGQHSRSSNISDRFLVDDGNVGLVVVELDFVVAVVVVAVVEVVVVCCTIVLWYYYIRINIVVDLLLAIVTYL
jgi:hypothetical protein